MVEDGEAYSAATRLTPRPPARVLSKNNLVASGLSPPSLNSFICSRRSSCDVDPSIRQIFHPLYSVAQSSYLVSYVLREVKLTYDDIQHCGKLGKDEDFMALVE